MFQQVKMMVSGRTAFGNATLSPDYFPMLKTQNVKPRFHGRPTELAIDATFQGLLSTLSCPSHGQPDWVLPREHRPRYRIQDDALAFCFCIIFFRKPVATFRDDAPANAADAP